MSMGLPTRAKPRAVSRKMGLIEIVDGQKRLIRAARMTLPARAFTDGLRASIVARSAVVQVKNLLQLSNPTDRQAMVERSTWLTRGKKFPQDSGSCDHTSDPGFNRGSDRSDFGFRIGGYLDTCNLFCFQDAIGG